MKWKNISIILVIFIICLVILLIPIITRTTNCGGNSAALWICRSYAVSSLLSSYDNNGVYHPDVKDYSFKKILKDIEENSWIKDTVILVRKNSVRLDENKKNILIIFSTPYDNCSQSTWFRKKEMLHAAGYSDGDAQLITPEEYKKIHFSRFINIEELIKNSK
ncbi:MAG: hypothetical protein KAI43_12805 [Candidatus Aureabacteria bacterium]|nr:hypothetical protein [Candidatus Auribacterota bacterium]